MKTIWKQEYKTINVSVTPETYKKLLMEKLDTWEPIYKIIEKLINKSL